MDSKSGTLFAYMTHLLSQGRLVFMREEALYVLGVSPGAFLDAAERQQRKGTLICPRQGFYIVVPPQYLSWGAPPPSWYLDDLMRYEGSPYYVGLLKAAELHGATHQAVMEFQVMTNKRLPSLRVGRSSLVFYYRKDLTSVGSGIQERQTETGTVKISSPELTLLDLVRYPRATGGLDPLATVLDDLVTQIDPQKLALLAPAFEKPVLQRLGYLLEHFGGGEVAKPLHQVLTRASLPLWTQLEPTLLNVPGLTREPLEQNRRWRLVVHRLPEKDQ